ncbi:MAG: FKBP-type peptidyl-prolyl cis-trans isomerase [Longimicrobiales bacterium]
MPRSSSPVVAPLLALLLVSCGGSTEPEVELEVIEEVEFAPSLNIDLSQMTKVPPGFYYQDLTVGEGDEARTGDRAFLQYILWLRTGQLIEAGDFDFVVGSGFAIQGFDLGTIGMRRGGVRKLVIPPGLAYGATGSGPIPPGAVLVFQLELDSIG